MPKLPDILPFCGVNAGGLVECVRLFPVSTVVAVPPVVDGQHQGALQVSDQQAFLDIWFTPGTGEFIEPEADDNQQGPYFKPRLVLEVSKDDPDLNAALAALRRHRYFLAVYLDANNLSKLIGTPDAPLVFSGNLETGKRGTDRNGHTLTFAGESATAAAFYTELTVPSATTRRAFSSGFSFGFQR
jgi:hypothetical protein